MRSTLKTYLANLKAAFDRQLLMAYQNNKFNKIFNHQFENGTLIISEPGVYRLEENIVFNPNNVQYMKTVNASNTPYESGDVLPAQYATTYPPDAFGIGFFAAIVIQTHGVILDLNGFSITQAQEHQLQQKFYAHIELANMPFIPKQGPHNFGPLLKPATRTYILNGILDNNSHHGIHGNMNQDIIISNVTFKDFEVAACAINGAKNVWFDNCRATNNKNYLPVLATFSQSRFIRPFINHLVAKNYTGTLKVKNTFLSAINIRDALKTAMNNVFQDIITSGSGFINKGAHPKEHALYHNADNVIDGNFYGFLINNIGVAVNGFSSEMRGESENVLFENVSVQNLNGSIHEIVALKNNSNKVEIDPVGAVFTTQSRDSNGLSTIMDNNQLYVGNVLANAQLLVAKAKLSGFSFGHLDVSRLSISSETIQWAEGARTYQSLLDRQVLCNGDSMFHVNKGAFGFRLEGIHNLEMNNCCVFRVKNIGLMGSNQNCSSDYLNKKSPSHPDGNLNGYTGCYSRGCSLASCEDVQISNLKVFDVESSYGHAIGVDILKQSKNIRLESCDVGNIRAGTKSNLSQYQSSPVPYPLAIGVGSDDPCYQLNFVNNTIGSLSSPYEVHKYHLLNL